jgi:hypothetical protein
MATSISVFVVIFSILFPEAPNSFQLPIVCFGLQTAFLFRNHLKIPKALGMQIKIFNFCSRISLWNCISKPDWELFLCVDMRDLLEVYVCDGGTGVWLLETNDPWHL